MRQALLALAFAIVLGSCQHGAGSASGAPHLSTAQPRALLIGGVTFNPATSGLLNGANACFPTDADAHFLPFGKNADFLDFLYAPSSARGIPTVRMQIFGNGVPYSLQLARAIDGGIYVIAHDDLATVPRIFLPADIAVGSSWIGGFDDNHYTIVSTECAVPQTSILGAIHLSVSDPRNGKPLADAYYLRDFGFVLIVSVTGDGWDRPCSTLLQ